MSANADDYRGKVNRWFVAGIIGIVVLLAFAGCVVSSFNTEDSADNDQYEAIAQCEARIDDLLKSPATASYDTTATASSGEWTVTGTVDSENSFGANIRSSFQCTVTVHEDSATTKVDFLE